MKLPLEGGCQCGRVRYRIDGAPLTVIACHCRECQKQSASAFGMTMTVRRDDFRFTAGEPARWQRTTASGGTLGAAFCPDCGVRLFHEPSNKPTLNIKAGTLDDTSWLKPAGHIWTDSAQPWMRDKLEGLTYPGQPESFDALFAAFRAQAAD
jgi:hypothetical protein